MPLIPRADGVPVKSLGLVRRMLPYLMPGRNESAVYFEQLLDMTKTLEFVASYSARGQKITVFHVVLAALARGLAMRPGLDRFVAGRTIYQRKKTELAFAVKKAMRDEAPLATVKLESVPGESFETFIGRIQGLVGEGRSDTDRPVDKELKLLFKLPGFVLGWVVALGRWLDRWNLLPNAMMKTDPLFASIFVANLGSIKVGRVFHHLYEWGTCSLFCAIGGIDKEIVVGPGDEPVVKPILRLRFSFDERINDGHYCVAGLELIKGLIESPERLLEPWVAQKG